MPKGTPTMRRDWSGSRYGWSGKDAAMIVGISYRQIDYWARTGLVEPSLTSATPGSGNRRLYSAADIAVLRIIRKALDAGMSLPRVREAISSLGGAILVDGDWVLICGGTLHICREFTELEHVIKEEPCWIFRFRTVEAFAESDPV